MRNGYLALAFLVLMGSLPAPTMCAPSGCPQYCDIKLANYANFEILDLRASGDINNNRILFSRNASSISVEYRSYSPIPDSHTINITACLGNECRMLSPFQTNQYCGKSYDISEEFILARLMPIKNAAIALSLMFLFVLLALCIKKSKQAKKRRT